MNLQDLWRKKIDEQLYWLKLNSWNSIAVSRENFLYSRRTSKDSLNISCIDLWRTYKADIKKYLDKRNISFAERGKNIIFYMKQSFPV